MLNSCHVQKDFNIAILVYPFVAENSLLIMTSILFLLDVTRSTVSDHKVTMAAQQPGGDGGEPPSSNCSNPPGGGTNDLHL